MHANPCRCLPLHTNPCQCHPMHTDVCQPMHANACPLLQANACGSTPYHTKACHPKPVHTRACQPTNVCGSVPVHANTQSDRHLRSQLARRHPQKSWTLILPPMRTNEWHQGMTMHTNASYDKLTPSPPPPLNQSQPGKRLSYQSFSHLTLTRPDLAGKCDCPPAIRIFPGCNKESLTSPSARSAARILQHNSLGGKAGRILFPIVGRDSGGLVFTE